MYNELVAWLRSWSELPAHCECYESCDECDKQDLCATFTNESIIAKAGEAADAIEVLSKKETTTPRWISVEERLPNQNDGRLYICLIVGGEYDQLSWYELCDFAEGRFWTQESASECHVTHWMPLPEPPKEEN